jgi:superfamily II DNA or RNA helicase
MTHREWQIESFEKLDRCNTSNKQEVIPVNACVGSGKTNVASYSLGSFIKNNQDKKTIQAFITPRIKLCAQQAKEIEEFIKNEFDLTNNKDYDVIRKDCTQHELNLSN